MIKIKLVAVGTLREDYQKEGVREFAKRLSRFCDFELVEVKEENFISAPNEKERLSIIKKEGERLLAAASGKIVLFDVSGKKYSSESFAKLIKDEIDFGSGELTFAIGGSYGLSEEVRARAAFSVSFSDMTFPHGLFRVMAAEQIYRAFTIIGKMPYHK